MKHNKALAVGTSLVPRTATEARRHAGINLEGDKMGHFFAVTAFNTNNENAVSDAVISYSQKYEVNAKVLDNVKEPNENTHSILFDSNNGWTIVVWPPYFNIYDVPLAEELSKKLDLLVSTINVYDGDYWCHYFFDKGEMVDKYCSIPNYWAEDETDGESFIKEFIGNPKSVAQLCGIQIEAIEGYYIPLLDEKEYGKAYKDDEFELEDFWVFADFWKKLGINYPEDMRTFKFIIDMTNNFDKKLPEIQA